MKSRLRQGDTVSRAGFEAGFGSGRGAQERTAVVLGMTPGAYRRGGRGLVIRYTIVQSRLGRILVGATDRGVCAVLFGAADAALEADLRGDFPAATVVRDEVGMRAWSAAATAAVEHPHPGLAVPLDLQGTAFQLRVWNALRRIPPGETRASRDVAREIGSPGAAQAVGRACAANHVAVLVPCHRVLPARSDADTGGYRWGAERKRVLLELERGIGEAADAPGRSSCR